MNAALTTYFAGEKSAGLLVAGIGVAVLAGAVALFPARLELRPLAWTLMVWGVLELAIGVGLYLKTGPQVARLLAAGPAAMVAAEHARMALVQRNFVMLEGLWLALIVASAAGAVYWKSRFSVCGIALGMLVNASLLLAFDLVAERRGAAYFVALSAAASPRASSTVRPTPQ